MRSKNRTDFELLLEIHKETLEVISGVKDVLSGVKESINQLNDEHRQSNESIKEMIAVNKQFVKLIMWLLVITVVALVILAGAEKALKFLI